MNGRAVSNGVTEQAFLVKGFTNWKAATRCFSRHESCDCHKLCAAALASTVDVGNMLSQKAAAEKKANREYLLKLLSSVQFHACQGLALRGDGNEADASAVPASQRCMLWLCIIGASLVLLPLCKGRRVW